MSLSMLVILNETKCLFLVILLHKFKFPLVGLSPSVYYPLSWPKLPNMDASIYLVNVKGVFFE